MIKSSETHKAAKTEVGGSGVATGISGNAEIFRYEGSLGEMMNVPSWSGRTKNPPSKPSSALSTRMLKPPSTGAK
jgi:hypothetical protein